MVDYLSTSNSSIGDKSDNKNDLKNSTSTSVIMNQSLKKQDQILSPDDIASDDLTSLSSETAECLNNQRYIKTPIHRLLTNQNYFHSEQTYTTITSSSNEINPNFQHKSNVYRHVSPHPPSFRQGIIDTNNIRSLRKTRSMIFPKIMNTTRHRSRTASTPELKVDNQKLVSVTTSVKENIRWQRIYRIWSLVYNMYAIRIMLDCIILISGLIHLTAVIILTAQKNLILMIIKQEIHTLMQTTFIIISLILLIYSIVGFYFLRKGRQQRAIHAACSLIMALIMLLIASMQNKVERNILQNIEMNMLSMIDSETIYLTSSILDKFHTTFKCCGVKGNFDWCKNEKLFKEINLITNRIDSKNLLGIYICSIPISCCALNNKFNISVVSNSQNSCLTYPTPWNTYRSGCLTPLKLEVYYMGTIYRVICYTTITVLILSMASSILLCIYP